MKKLTLTVLTATTLLFATKTTAQEVKSQSEYIKTLKPSRYKIKASDYNYRGEMNIASVTNDHSQPIGNYNVHLEMFPDKEKESDRDNKRFFRDNLAFPATYVWNHYTGMEKVQKRAGYVLDNRRDVGTQRLIVLNDYIFVIQDWKSKDKYYGITILDRTSTKPVIKEKKKKKKKGGLGVFFKVLKEGYKNASTGGNGSIDKLKSEVLQPYLDKAFAKQEVEKKKPKFIASQKKEDALREKVKKAERDYVKYYNDSLSNTPEYRKIAAQRARLSKSSVKVYNYLNKAIYVGDKPNAPSMGLMYIPSGGHYDQWMHCRDVLYYYFSDNEGALGTKFYSGNKCGGSVSIK